MYRATSQYSIECDSDLTTILFMKLAMPRNFKTTFYSITREHVPLARLCFQI